MPATSGLGVFGRDTPRAAREIVSFTRAPVHDVTVQIQQVPARTLTRWNYAMTLFHAALAATTLAVGNLDLQVPVYKTRIDFQYRNGTANATNTTARERPWELVPLYEESGSLPFTWLTATFFLLSAAFHLGNAVVWRTWYIRQLQLCYTPSRWIEYFFSAPVMIVLISYTLGIRSRAVLLANAALVAITMPFGYWVELLARPAGSSAWTRPLRVRLAPWALGHVPQVTAWFLIVLQFYDGHDETDRAPWFVHLILWVELLLFFSFGAASLLSQWYAPKFFYRGEILFQVLSLVSKGLLGMLLLANVLMLSRFDDLYDA